MASIQPFRALRPRTDIASRVISPPYDVLTEDEARKLVDDNPLSFVHVIRPEVNLARGSDPHGQQAYRAARIQLDRLVEEGALIQDNSPRLYLYGQKMPIWGPDGKPAGYHEQVGLLACCSVDEYDKGLIRKHEHTRPDKVEDRTRHMEVLDAQVGLVFLAYREQPEITGILDQASTAQPEWTVTSEDGVQHSLWIVSDPQSIDSFKMAFESVPLLYVADGHHRSQSASRFAEKHPENTEARVFLAGIFPHSRLRVMAYNRLVADLAGHSSRSFLQRLGEHFDIRETESPVPCRRGIFTMYLQGRWYKLEPDPGVVPEDPVGSLDVSVLQEQVLGPILDIGDPRTDTRIKFVGGIRGHRALRMSVDNGEAAVAFHLFPTGMDQLLAVADAGRVMPPKSTWFEPKLRSGVVLRKLS